MMTVSSASRAGSAAASASEATRTEPMPSRSRVRMIRTAISPRLAMRTLEITSSGSRTGHNDPYRGGIEAVARVVDLGAVADDDKRVHVSLGLHPQPRRRDA